MRIAAGVEYCGTEFVGWQKQDNGRTIQHCIETAISNVANHPVTVHCAGRTDSGVHAIDQVIHFDTDASRDYHSWVFGVNTALPEDISINWVSQVDNGFHARFSAMSRHYRYFILNRTFRSSLLNNLTAWEVHNLDENAMSKAAESLIGKHDFTSFRATACQSKSPIREIKELTVERIGDFVIIDVIANAFLHHMVRNIAGVLMQIGRNKYPVHWAKDVLETRDRKQGGITAPAGGLYLINVKYPEQYDLPSVKLQIPYDFLSIK